MKLNKIGVCALLLVVFSRSAFSLPFSLEARSMGMGNVAVATADMATAAFANPAMLAFQRENDDFSLLIGVGGYLNDSEGLIDDIDDFQDAFNSGSPEAVSFLQQMANKVVAPEISAAVAVGFATDVYAMALSARSDVLAVGTVTGPGGFGSPLDTVNLENNLLDIQGLQVTEVGFSIATNAYVGERKLSIGLTPKVVSVETIFLLESVATAGTDLKDLLDEDQVQDLGSYTTVDLGIAYELTNSIHVGLVGKNLITEEITITSIAGTPVTLEFDMRWRAGAAYKNRFLTLGVDLDIIENDPIVRSPVFSGLKTQIVSLGMELNTFDFAQLRLGVIKNIASGLPDGAGNALYTVGAGFWLGFVLDVAVVSGEGDSLGAFVQTGFRF